MLKTLISTELKTFKSKSIIIQVCIITLSFVIPFVFMSGSILDGMKLNSFPAVMKANILEGFDNIFYFRMSLSFYLFISWMFIPKAFYGKKINGEIEAIISAGYSARNIWLGKSLATIFAALISAFPLFLIFLITFKTFIYLKYGFIALFNPMGFLFMLVINPLIIFGIILLIGSVQLVTDDYMKSSMVLFIVAFGNVFSLSLMRNLHLPNVKWLFLAVSLLIITALGITALIFARKVVNENLIVSLHKTNAKLFKLMKTVSEN
jgi:hypothetical protein